MAKDYQTAKEEARKLYKSFIPIGCPALGNELVHFTSEGFDHLTYRGDKIIRDERVQIMKFELLKKAHLIIEISTTFQEYDEGYEHITIEKRGVKIKESVLVRCWGFVAIIKSFRVKVVVRQVGNGKKEFYSVIPAWYIRQYRDIKVIENATSGGLLREEDDKEILKNATA